MTNDGAAITSVTAIQSGYMASQPSKINFCNIFLVLWVPNETFSRVDWAQIFKHREMNTLLYSVPLKLSKAVKTL